MLTPQKIKFWLKLFIIGLLVALFLPFIIYFITLFLNINIFLKDQDKWAQLGDFIGGILNPVLAVFNIFLLIVVAYFVYKFETDRAKKIQKQNIQPLCYVKIEDYEHRLKVVLVNDGLGPAKINTKESYIYYKTQYNEEKGDLHKLVQDIINNDLQKKNKKIIDPPLEINWKSYQINGIPKYIGTKDSITLIELEKNSVTDIRLDIFENFEELRNDVKNALRKISIKLVYADILTKDEKINLNNNGIKDKFELSNLLG